jgi:hypothetical protein
MDDAADWAVFRESTFGDGYMVWHDGPDFAELTRIARSDPQTVARMLRLGIGAGDPLAAESVGALAEAGLVPDGSEKLLRTAVGSARGTFLVRVAQALHVLTEDESWAEPIASVLAGGEHWSVRIDAAMALAGFRPTAELIEVLAGAVCDPEYLVRYHAANTLLRYAGQTQNVSEIDEIFDKIRMPADGEPSSVDRDGWRIASQRLTVGLA